MGLLDLFQTRAAEPEPEYETEEKVEPELSDSLLTALLHEDAVGPDRAMDIPAFAAAVDTIAGTVAALPVRLYRRAGDRVEEVRGDRRTELLNCDTGDSLTGAELRKAMVRDYYTRKGGFAYVNRSGNEVVSLHYVDPSHVSVLKNADAIFKEVVYSVDGRNYQPWQFVRILHDTSDGASGSSIVSQNQRLLSVAYQTLRYEQALVSRGGNKRGFLKSPRKLGDKALAALRRGFARLYGSNDENFVVLNDGEVTALAGSISLGKNSLLGVAMGTSEAVGYVTPSGSLTDWLNELAFAPVDYRCDAPRDEWSGDLGVGANYLSQQAVGRLAPSAGFEFPEGTPLPEQLKLVQKAMAEEDPRAEKIYRAVGSYLGYAVGHYADFYELEHLLLLGRVSSGKGGSIIIEEAQAVLRDEFPEHHVEFHIPDEAFKRHGQAVIAGTLPELG